MLAAMKEITVNAEWHGGSEVWVATSDDIWGLAAQAADFEALKSKVLPMIKDLLELKHVEMHGPDVPVHFVARVTNTLHLRMVA